MAGTGHPYEVVNSNRAREALAAFARSVRCPEGKAWFASPQVLKHATSETFVVQVSGDVASDAIERHAANDMDRTHLLRKLGSGGDLRLFIPEMLQHLGPDFSHIADWLSDLPEHDPRMLRKLGRVNVESAVSLAGRWGAALARNVAAASGQQGEQRVVIDTMDGRVWVELLDASALVAESNAMNHCVSTYAPRLGHGTRIFSLRDKHGASLATAEIRNGQPSPVAGQIKGHSNHLPGRETQGDIAELLNWATVGEDSCGNAAAAGLARDTEGRWCSLRELAERFDFCGFTSLGLGAEAWVLSPRNPEQVLVRLLGDKSGWWQPENSGRCRQILAVGERRADLDEQRAIAVLANAINADVVADGVQQHRAVIVDTALIGDRGTGPGGVVWVGGTWAAWRDVCRAWTFGGADILECWHHSDKVFVALPGGRSEPLVAVWERRRENRLGVADWERDPERRRLLEDRCARTGTLEAVVCAEREWSADEVRCVAAALDALGVETLDDTSARLRAAGLLKGPDGRWARFQDVAVRHSCPGLSADGRRLHWDIADWELRLGDEEGRVVASAQADVNGAITGLRASKLPYMVEVARMLSALKRRASTGYTFPYAGGQWVSMGIPSNVALLPTDTGWHLVSSPDELVATLKAAGRRQFRDPICTEMAIRLLPAAGTDSEADALLARHLAAWAALAAGDKAYSWRTGSAYAPFGRQLPRHNDDERLAEATSLRSLMLPRERAAIAKAATVWMRRLMGRTRRPEVFAPVERFRSLLLALADDLPQRFLDRAIPWAFWLYRLEAPKREDNIRRLETGWLDLAERLPRSKALDALIHAADDAMWNLRADAEAAPTTLKEAADWLRCATLAARRWGGGIWTDEAMDTLVRVAGERRDADPDGWDAVAAQAIALRPERRRRAA